MNVETDRSSTQLNHSRDVVPNFFGLVGRSTRRRTYLKVRVDRSVYKLPINKLLTTDFVQPTLARPNGRTGVADGGL